MPATSPTASSRALLDAAYSELDFDQGVLLPASSRPDAKHADDWLEKGDWQALAEEVGAEKIFFVDRQPAVVFAELSQSGHAAFRDLFNRVWCMARPQLLFLARPGELAVYNLSKPPVRPDEQPDTCRQLLDKAKSLAEVQAWRKRYHRELIETGVLFGEEHFGKELDRADHALIRDLKEVRRALDALRLREGVSISAARRCELLHSLIGRAIFIRYLEDRDIVTRDYFEKVVELHGKDARQKKEWRGLLNDPLHRPDLNPAMVRLYFPRVLRSKEFTYALFEQLVHDFNGDTFPVEDDERRSLLQSHLTTLRDFLLGVCSVGQQELFFYAYNFKIIPIELISSIYEEFYNERVGDDKNQGTHYTPPALVEFVLANTLTRSVLASAPRVLDPACGSGIFLVEAFRRMVRHLCAENCKERPTRQELRVILRKQIAGMDINEEAVRVAAFSLYLAFLHYQKPREILPDPGENLSSKPEKLRAIRLPHLKYVSALEKAQRQQTGLAVEFFDTLLAASAFDPVMGKCEAEANKLFGPSSADVIVGNPPWGDPTPKTPREKQAVIDIKKWCNPSEDRPLGDKERSQAFIHLTLSLLKDGGKAGLLVSSGVFFKHHENSKAFRRIWLNAAQLRQVVNFAHVRRVFFSGPNRRTKGISPFASVVFEKRPLAATPDNRFEYWSAKRTAVVENVKAVVMTHGDMHHLNQRDCLAYEKLWKIYWWGGRHDEALIKSLDSHTPFLRLPEKLQGVSITPGRGFLEGNKEIPSGWLADFMELPVDSLKRYGPQPLNALAKVPARVERRGQRDVFEGSRLLLRRGVPIGGKLTIRRETRPYCFRHSVLGFRLEGFDEWQEKVITGIYWSSLACYYFFATMGSWGMWHDELQVETAGELPIVLPTTAEARKGIVDLVKELENLDLPAKMGDLFGTKSPNRLPELERQLDEAIFDLYELGSDERDSVREMCTTGLDLFYHDHDSDAVKPVARPTRSAGTIADVARAEIDLAAYLRVFLEWWNRELAPHGEFAWRVLTPSSNAPLLAVVFETRSADDATTPFDASDDKAWHQVLKELAQHAHVPVGSSRIFTDTFFRIVTEHEILIVKRNERRFWTKSAAREDAEAAMLQTIVAQEKHRKK